MGIGRRLSDTTARDFLVHARLSSLLAAMHRQVRTASRKKQLVPVGLPCNIVAFDGKTTMTPCAGGPYAQEQGAKNPESSMKLSSALSCALALTALTAGTASAAPPAGIAARKVSYVAVPPAAITCVRQVGRSVEGKITFAPTLGGTPTGTATEACARVKVSATKHVVVTDDLFDPGIGPDSNPWPR